MTAKEKQGFGLYFLLAFGLAWLLQVYASLLLLRDGNAAAYQLLLVVSMFCPLVSVLLVQKFWLHQPTGISWRPRLKGNGRYLLAAWFGPAVFTRAGRGAVLCGVPLPAGLFRQLAGNGLRRGVDAADPAQPSWACPRPVI